ncbi:beta-galactosidase [Sphingomonas glacialis]|uniref:Beta-galactosidase n=1 Tax=Sphingomonas glacialis TaxID=658225 RepID=A0A502FRD5_9SPHN|nr:beta-galactosidase [Sphingomonas glacialis]TPG52127.1 beta-galactosidase [Sphingomonas glacialis]
MIVRAALAAAALLVSASATAQSARAPHARATNFPGLPPVAVGTSWYPEQWPEERWATDLALMRKAGFNTVRIGEFAWSKLEPTKGKFDFTWLDRAIAAAAKHGMMVVLGTPTAAPPAWLTSTYPDTLRVDEDGKRATHGARRHFSFASARYRSFARTIASEMAKRYGHDPRVVGWQIDNEIGPPSFDPEAVARWHAFLKDRYGTIDTLNARWATEYWSQFYNSFDQVPLHATGQQNPALLLDFKHFTTATWTDYVANQAQAIRATADPRQFVTTNTMFWNSGFDHFALHRDLDLAAWDNYIPNGRPDWVANGANHDLVRGYKQRNFWLMETQPGRVDWVPINRALDPGQVREMAWQAIGHGADAVLYWQWRPARNGQESYHGSLLGQDGKPNPILAEVTQTAHEITAAATALADTAPVAKVAMLFSYDSRWAIDLQPLNKGFDPVREFTDFYRPLRVAAQGVAVLPVEADLSHYPLVVAPALNVMTAETAQRLAAYAAGGGHLVLGPRSGMKDDANALWPNRQPGPLAGALGAHVEQFYALDTPVGITGGVTGTVSTWAEALLPDAADTQVVARYTDPGGWLNGKPAIVTRPIGKGSITYVGAWLDPVAMRGLATRLLDQAGVKPILGAIDPDVEVSARAGARRCVLVLINHGTAAHPVALPAGARVVTGSLANGTLQPHAVAVVQTQNEAPCR